jgi:AbrB family looped-hinge helix DNA binding protein
MAEYIVKVGKKGELYTPKKLRVQMGLDPGDEFIAVVKDEEIILRKRKTLVSLLEEDSIGKVTEKDLKKEREVLEEELMGR